MFYSISLTVGIILLALSLIIFKKSLAFIKQSDRAIGTVIELERISDTDGVTFKPIFKFKTSTNQEIIYRHISSSSPSNWDVGEQATIAYDPNIPTKARLLTYFGTFSWTIVLMAISMPLIVIGGGYYVAQAFLK
ncbi:MAG: DUF3592 domain-containing protein [Ferruginibacter sp.]